MPDLRTVLRAELRAIVAGGVPEFVPALADEFAATGRRLLYERQYFARRRCLAATAIVGTDDALAAILADVCDERSWALPAHWGEDDPYRCVDLFACETAGALAEIVRSRPDADGAERVRAEVRARVVDPFFAAAEPFHWEHEISNWTAVCAGGAGMAALALGDDVERIGERVLPLMRRYLGDFGPDGGCVEGIYYWAYGFGYYTYFAEAWREATGEDLLAGTEAIAGFPAAVQLGAGSFATFGDADEDPFLPTGLLVRLHERLGTAGPVVAKYPAFADDHCARWAPLTRTLDWAGRLDVDAEYGGPGSLGFPGARDGHARDGHARDGHARDGHARDGHARDDSPNRIYPIGYRPRVGRAVQVPEGRHLLPDVGWYVERRRFGGNLWALAVKGGHNGESHNHLDLGSFILACEGEQLLCDPGAGEYTADYFGPKRYESAHPSARWHSVPNVDGEHQLPGPDARAALTAHGDGVEARIDAYGGPVVRRRFTWDEHGIAIADALEPHDQDRSRVGISFVSRIRPDVATEAGADGTATWTGACGAVRLHGVDVGTVEFDHVDAQGTGGEPDRLWALRFTARGPLRLELR